MSRTVTSACPTSVGKEVIGTEEMVAKLQAALDACRDDALLVIARTDARQGLGLDAALERAGRYKEAGADVIFVEAPQSREDLAEVGRRVPGPLLVNIVEGGDTPQLPAVELAAVLDRMIGWEERQALVGKPFFDELSDRYATPPEPR